MSGEDMSSCLTRVLTRLRALNQPKPPAVFCYDGEGYHYPRHQQEINDYYVE